MKRFYMKTNPLITVITVVYNGEKYLEETILSVINQSYENIEYIIIDGGSTDGTLDIIKKYEDKIAYWVSEKDKGIYDAMNKGIKTATGEWLNFMNAGDHFYSRDILAKLFDNLNQDEYDLIYSDILFSNNKLLQCDIGKNIINHQALIYRRVLHDEVGLYLVAKDLLISDYLFFMLCKEYRWLKSSELIAVFDIGGVSGNRHFISHLKQKIGVDLMFGNISRLKASRALITYSFIKRLKSFVKRIINA